MSQVPSSYQKKKSLTPLDFRNTMKGEVCEQAAGRSRVLRPLVVGRGCPESRQCCLVHSSWSDCLGGSCNDAALLWLRWWLLGSKQGLLW